MTAFVALLRAVNVGGTAKLPMSELKAMCEALDYEHVKTYIASGNVVFKSRKSETAVKAALEKQLEAYAGKPVGVLVRTAAELAGYVKWMREQNKWTQATLAEIARLTERTVQRAWRTLKAPTLEQFEVLAEMGFRRLPQRFRALRRRRHPCRGLPC